MDWCVASSYEQANHNPTAVLAGDKTKAVAHLAVEPGAVVSLDASGTFDPDGDDVSCRWFVYPEAGTYGSSVPVERYAAPQARLVVPEVDKPCTVHVILEIDP